MNIDSFIPVYDKEKRLTPPDLFDEIMNIVRQAFFTDETKRYVFDGKLTLDYSLSEAYQWYCKEIISDIGFDIECLAQYGGSEGIYINVSLHGYLGILPDPKAGRLYPIGTIKTLSDDFDAMRACGELAGVITAVGRKLIDKNHKNFMAVK